MNAQELQEIRERVDAVTTGPLSLQYMPDYLDGIQSDYDVKDPNGWNVAFVVSDKGLAEFIIHAPADVRNLLAEVDRLTAELATVAAANARLAAERDAMQRNRDSALKAMSDARRIAAAAEADRDAWKEGAYQWKERYEYNTEDAYNARINEAIKNRQAQRD